MAGGNLRIRNWRQYQHYKHRDPPWIKLHVALLQSRDWVMWDDASRLLAVACMLLASRSNGELPADPEYIKRAAYLNTTPDLRPLIACGFLEDASGALADASKVLVRGEQSRGEENAASKTLAAPATNGRQNSKGTRLPTDWQPDQADLDYARGHQLLDQHLATEVEKFRNYWTAKSGREACKRDWHATWRNWVLNANFGGRPSPRSPRTHDPRL